MIVRELSTKLIGIRRIEIEGKSVAEDGTSFTISFPINLSIDRTDSNSGRFARALYHEDEALFWEEVDKFAKSEYDWPPKASIFQRMRRWFCVR